MTSVSVEMVVMHTLLGEPGDDGDGDGDGDGIGDGDGDGDDGDDEDLVGWVCWSASWCVGGVEKQQAADYDDGGAARRLGGRSGQIEKII